MTKNICYFLILIISCISCKAKREQSKELKVSQTVAVAQVGEEIVFYYNKDIIKNPLDNCKDDSTIYVYIRLNEQNKKTKTFNLSLKNDSVSFVVPNNAAYLHYSFYNICDAEEDEWRFVRIRYKNETFVKNAFYDKLGDTSYLNKQIEVHPNYLPSYSNHIVQLANSYYLGQIDESTLHTSAEKYLQLVENKANTENASDLEALASLYAFSKNYEQAQQVILDLYKKYPNSQELVNASENYWFSEHLFRQGDKDYNRFYDELIKQIAKHNPQSSLGINTLSDTYSDNIYGRLFSNENILKNLDYYTKNIHSNNFIAQKDIVKINLELNNRKDAEKGAKKYLESMLNNDFIHYSPIPKSQREVSKESYIADAYELLAEVSKAKGNFIEAIVYLDSAILLYESDNQNRFKASSIQNNYSRKASLQKDANLYNQALQTYETLYKETKDDKVLDSIKVLFKETQQEKGYESYVENLKERVENENTKPKQLAANFSIKDMSGYEIKLSDWKGHVVVLNFWANYCLPCAKEIPFMNELWRETQTDEIIFLAATKNTPLEVTRFAQRQKEMFGFSVLPNAKELFDVYDVNLVPTTIVISKTGEIIYQKSGFTGNIDKLKKVILEELEK